MALSVSSTANNTANSASSVTLSVTANAGDDIFLAAAYGNTVPTTVATSVVGATTWTKRTASTELFVNSVYTLVEIWYSKNVSALAGSSVAVNYSGSRVAVSALAVSVSGADTSTPFDGNAALPVITNAGSANPPASTISTTNANTILFTVLNGLLATGLVPTGYTEVDTPASSGIPAPLVILGYKIVSAAQSSAAVTWGTGAANALSWNMINDAFRAPAAGDTLTNQTLRFMRGWVRDIDSAIWRPKPRQILRPGFIM